MIEEPSTNETEQSSQRGHQRRPLSPRGRVTVFPNWCKGCNLCVEFCPTGVLQQGDDGRVIVVHPEKCTGCRWCELHCPDFAIFVSDVEPTEEDGDEPPAGDNHRPGVSEEEVP